MGSTHPDHAEGDRKIPAPPHSPGVVPLPQPQVPEEEDDGSGRGERGGAGGIHPRGRGLHGGVHYIPP